MTVEALRAEIDRLAPWFHAIELPGGVRTKTVSLAGEPLDHPARSWQTIARVLPDSLAGRSLLDVGCNGGFYMVEAKRRGAGRVLGVDAARHHVNQALFVGRALGLDFEVRRLSVYDLDPRDVGRFDVTLALGLVYHCKHPVLALERLFEVTKETLVLESAIVPADRFPPPSPYLLGGIVSTLHPLAFVENPSGSNEAAHNWFLPSPSSLEAMLRQVGFVDVRIVSVAEERVVLTAAKPPRASRPLAARLTLLEAPETAVASEAIELRVRVENKGALSWPAAGTFEPGRGPVRLGAHLFTANGTLVSWDHARADLPADVSPDEAATVVLRLRAPRDPGAYRLELDLVAEHWTWFEEAGATPLSSPLAVGPAREGR
jgi:tRNA (mo5U34)-methyltransferase